jgi:transcriptional regulator with XRE-family HTH domain
MFKVNFDNEYFAYMVNAFRTKAGLSMRDLAKLTDISASTISRIERGEKPDIDTFGQLCEWMRYDPGKFFYVDPERMPDVQLP